MSTLNLWVKYRPLRIGWCIRNRNYEDFRRALRLTHLLWGGCYNPLIPVDDFELARQLVNVFRLDALYPISNDQVTEDFIKKFPYLPWPLSHKELFINDSCGILTISHVIRRINQRYATSDDINSMSAYRVFEWDNADPLRDVWLATFGGVPSPNEVGQDFSSRIEKSLDAAKKIHIAIDKPLCRDAYHSAALSYLSAYALLPDWLAYWGDPGVYVGDAQDFTDLVNFWNLQASNIVLRFYDVKHAERLDPAKEEFLTRLRSRPRVPQNLENRISLWSKTHENHLENSLHDSAVSRCFVDTHTWTGLKVKPPVMGFSKKSILGAVDDSNNKVSVSFQLPEKPFFDDPYLHTQHVVVSVSPLVDVARHGDFTFSTPYLPELNEYLGRECHFQWNQARAEVEGIGIITDVNQNHLTLRALKKRELVTRIFSAFGMTAQPSPAGLVGERLIRQMGGLQGCCVFKIAGVRELIADYGPSKSFTKNGAFQKIGKNNPHTGKPNFTKYEELYIEYRSGGKLKPEHTFQYLVKKKVFRVGLNFECPSCQLKFWLSIDDVKTEIKCEYCGNEFNMTTQLKDRDWAYRRSGLFGRDDHQQGGIPVALPLQQLNTGLGLWEITYTTGMEIKPETAPVKTCESDLVAMIPTHSGQVQLLIGECKTGKEITGEDVSNLKKVAEAFPRERFDVFIVFSKLDAPFTPEEIQRCKSIQDQYESRVILLSARELEAIGRIYEDAAKEFEIGLHVPSLEYFAHSTRSIYFDPKPRQRQTNS